MELKSVVDAIEKGNTALAEHRRLAEEALAKAEKNEGGIGEIKAAQEKAFAEFTSSMKAVEDAMAKANKPNIKAQAAEEEKEAAVGYASDFKGWIRGKVSDQEMKGIEAKARESKALASTTSSGADGGYAVPKVIDSTIENLVMNISPIRAEANVVQIGTNDYHKLVNLKGMASGWVAETSARPATNTPTLTDIAIKAQELYANPQATQVMMDDVFFDAEQWISEELAEEFARAEGAAFVAGDGVNKPFGILSGTPVATADGARAFGTLQYVPTGVAANWAATNPADILFTLAGSLKARYRENAKVLLNKAILFDLSAFKDSSGRYIYNPISAPGVLPNILGYPVIEAEDMPAKAANAIALAFGDFKRGYTIVDRKGMTMLRDPYSNKPYVGFYTVKRVGGAIVNSEAIKLVKFAVS